MIALSITPNPSKDFVEITIINNTLEGLIESVRIYDVLGVEVLIDASLSRQYTSECQGRKTLALDISSLSPGVYFVCYGSQILKFIKI